MGHLGNYIMALNIPGFESLFKRSGQDNLFIAKSGKTNEPIIEKQATEVIVNIDPSGDTDDIEEAIKMVEDGGVIRIKEGIYKVRKTITISKNNISIIGSGSGTVIRPVAPDDYWGGRPIFIITGDNNTMKNMTFNMDPALGNADNIPIGIENCKFTTIKNITVQNSTTEAFIIDNADNNIITENFMNDGVVLVTSTNGEKNIISKPYLPTKKPPANIAKASAIPI